MKKPVEEILDACLEKIKQGVAIDEILRQHPDYADEVKELLVIAKDIKDTPLPQPSDRAISACLIKIGETLQLQREISYKKRLPKLFYFPAPIWARALAFMLIIIFISWGTVSLSAQSMPGDILYPIKIITEKVKYFLTINPEGKVELRLIYSEERTKELVKHLDKKGTLNLKLLKAMLDEAALVLENLSGLSESERQVYFSKIEHLNAYQKDVLENLKPKVVSQEEELDNAISMCSSRMQWIGKMRRKEVPPGKWGPCCNWK